MAAAQITRDNMFEPLLAADPSFGSRWTDFMAEWGHEAEPPLYIALGSLADHILECLDADRTDRFDAIFAVIERWHIEGDDYVGEAATIGLLESLQNLIDGSDRNRMSVERWLGPESKRWWDKLDLFWAGVPRALSFDTF